MDFAMTSDIRKTPRTRSLLGARVIFNRRSSTMDCVVRNISTGGAMLLFTDAVDLPETFELEISQRQRTYAARVMWRHGKRIGVAFDSVSADGEIPLYLAQRLRAFEVENALLKNRIAQLSEAG